MGGKRGTKGTYPGSLRGRGKLGVGVRREMAAMELQCASARVSDQPRAREKEGEGSATSQE